MSHFYILEVLVTKPTSKETLRFNGYNSNSTFLEDLFCDLEDSEFDRGFERAVETFTCREALIDSLCCLEEAEFPNKYKYSAGIRCFGEMFSKHAYHYLKKPKAAKLISEFIKNVFKLNISVGYGIEKQVNLSVNNLVKCKDKQKPNNGYVTLYFNPKEFSFDGSSIFISAILALFREQRVYSKIVNGEINSLETLVKELIDISWDRAFRKDLSYDHWGLVFSSYDTLSEVKTKILDNLTNSENGEGSDWYSIMLLAVYFMTNKSKNSSGSYSGPCEYAEEEATKATVKKVHKICGDRFLILSRIESESNFFTMLTEGT